VRSAVFFSRKTDEWETPQKLFDALNREFDFKLDVAATSENAKCERFYTKEDSGLDHDWLERNWCNPPYSQIGKWVLKARREQLKGNLTVMFIPARTETIWFHDSIYQKPNVEIRFLRKRVVFVGAKWNAPFPSMIVIFR
jgi:site-specific DNA-methyltransferase (adenine-specific)